MTTRFWPIIGMADVTRNMSWYQTLLGLAKAPPRHDYFGQVATEDGPVLVYLHAWGEHDHPTLSGPDVSTPGHGLILYFWVDDLEAAVLPARALVDELEEEPARNPGTGNLECALRDPDGYYVMLSADERR